MAFLHPWLRPDRWAVGFLFLQTMAFPVAGAAPAPVPLSSGERMLTRHFEVETSSLSNRCLAEVKTKKDWERLQPLYRRQLFEMLGLDPLPSRGDLHPVVTGQLEREEIVVEKLHFQSSPGLYVTANLYRPRQVTEPLPTVLYLSGHGPVISNGVSYGNKVAYQHHGIWFARNGYVCLVLDTLQLGEIQGLHHGTYNSAKWWWNSRGYTPAGVEAWNSLRALDYLQTRSEVDTNRVGATGRSGGGAYSWWIAALDDRIRVVAPVAGITDLHNHVVDGTVEGHCDCMFMVNSYRWDYPQVAALVAPRPLLLVNTDSDSIFPLDGVVRTQARVRRIYSLLQAPDQFGLVIGPGPHKDTPDLQVPVFRWMNRHLKHEDPPIEKPTVKWFTPAELKVFATLPSVSLNTNIDEGFVPGAPSPTPPSDRDHWSEQRDAWKAALLEKSFAAWPDISLPLELDRKFSAVHDGVRLEAWEFTAQEGVRLRFYVAQAAAVAKPEALILQVLDDDAPPDPPRAPSGFARWLSVWRPGFTSELKEEIRSVPLAMGSDPATFASIRQQLAAGQALGWFAPRGIGWSAWGGDESRRIQIRRRFMLLGETLDGMRAYDLRRCLRALSEMRAGPKVPIFLQADAERGCDALYAALFETELAAVQLRRLPESHRLGPDYLNVLRVLDLPQVVAMVAERTPLRLVDVRPEAWQFPVAVGARLGWGSQQLLIVPASDGR